ncbi:MAG: helix-turn-helix transcriptional regulator [Gammaproteobacteria bacterium]
MSRIVGDDMERKPGSRQRQILELLLARRGGLSIDEVAASIGVSRTAVQQHFTVLEQRGYVEKAARHKTGGRPVQTYVLTDIGVNYFPKQYAWFSELLLRQLKNEMGHEAVVAFMANLGAGLAQELAADLHGKPFAERLTALLAAMQELGFQANVEYDAAGNSASLTALHCVYHDLAQVHPEVCQFDRALLAGVAACSVEQVECMAEGGRLCCFKLKINE